MKYAIIIALSFAAGAATKDFLARNVQKGLRWIADRI
jgi:hypothetical protein